MKPKTSELWARIEDARVAIELLLIKRFYSVLSDLVTEEYGLTLFQKEPFPTGSTEDLEEIVSKAVPLRVYRSFQEVLDKWPEQDLGDMLMIAGSIAPDLPRKVVARLGWGPDQLAKLNLTGIFAENVEAESSGAGALRVKVSTGLARLQARFSPHGKTDEDDAA